ncbi:ABC transporter permease [Blastopirellula marina]|uniref:Putative ABC transporter integral membrane protein n=1 Tax=Blastopirellula marina DSM 3645 TaxID=314230 RepID=A3ZPB9_9BACT|nr:ABC transporter permease [Blastopirellula marina]EAQ81597.1 putative ABC transporter integral membrane protein [Blastopirellula marina DSM 3645]
MSLILRLFLAHARQQKVRLALTLTAMIAAIGVVLWVVSAYEKIASKFDDQTANFVGSYEVFVIPKELDDQLSAELLAELESDQMIAEVNPVAQFRMAIRRVGPPPEGSGPPGRGMGRMGPTVVGTSAGEPRYPLTDGQWLHEGATDEAVVSSGIAEALKVRPGDSIEIVDKEKRPFPFTVVGVVEQVDDVEFAMMRTKGGAPGGTNRGPASLAAYVPMSAVEKFTGSAPAINLIEIRLDGAAKLDQLGQRVDAVADNAELLRPEDIQAKIAGGFEAEGARKQAYFVTALSILASAFIIFTTLSMGVNERARQLAVLRAVGLRRTQVATLVLTEALALALFGWLGGLLGGWILLLALASATPQLFPDGVTLGGTSVLLTAGCSLLGAMLAAIFPIWKATRISPLEAMAPLQVAPGGFRSYGAVGLVSLVLIGINPLLVYLPSLPETLRLALVLFVGAPATIVGFILLAPLVVLVVEKLISPILATVMRLQNNLVQTQLSTNMWRSAGIAASLMLGLGLYTATQVWGWSMLSGFLPGRWTPDVIVKFDPGLPVEAVEKVRQTEGVLIDQFLSVAVEQTKLVGDPLKSRQQDSAVRQDNVCLIGLDAAAGLGGDRPLFPLDFVQGSRDEAIAKLKRGRYCIVPDTFHKFAGLNLGDKIGFIPPNDPDHPIEYEIAGIAAMPGSNWITKTTGLRRNSVRTAGLAFASEQQVRDDFVLPRREYFWLNTASGVTAEQLQERLQSLVSVSSRGGRPEGKERADGQENRRPPIAAATDGPTRRGPGAGGRRGDGPIQVSSIKEVRDGMRLRAGAAISAMGWLPLITLIVVSLGIANTIAASVRARRWEFGVLRAVGLKRLGLSRLVLSEALLIGVVASLLSLAFGVIVGWSCLGLVRYVSNAWFEGVATTLIIPWNSLWFGYVLTFVLCTIAALWPAISAGRTEPLTLLQAGRAAT